MNNAAGRLTLYQGLAGNVDPQGPGTIESDRYWLNGPSRRRGIHLGLLRQITLFCGVQLGLPDCGSLIQCGLRVLLPG